MPTLEESDKESAEIKEKKKRNNEGRENIAHTTWGKCQRTRQQKAVVLNIIRHSILGP